MNPNRHPHLPRRPAMPGQLSDGQGGVLLNKIPDPIPWGAFVGCALRIMDEGKPAVVVLDPQTTTDVDEAISLFRVLLAMHTPKPGPLAWETVPENVRRHFRFVGPPAESSPATPPKNGGP